MIKNLTYCLKLDHAFQNTMSPLYIRLNLDHLVHACWEEITMSVLFL